MGKLSKLFDRAGDMFMPKELAPFASILAPMLVGPIGGFSGLGMGLGMGLGQLASAKMNSGKLDPFNALAVYGAGMTPEARAMRMRGRIDPSQGTIGQKLSGGIADAFGGTGMGQTNAGQVFTRALDPTQSMKMNQYKNYLESDAMAKAAGPFSGADIGLGGADIGLGSEYIAGKPTFYEAMKADYESYYGKKAAVGESAASYDDNIDEILDDPSAKFETKITESGPTQGNLSPAEFEGYEAAKDKDVYLANLSRRGGDQGFFSSAAEGVSGALFPGFNDSFDEMTGKGTGFNFTKALTTVATATSLTQIMPMAEELKKQEMKDREEEGAMWRTWFESYTKSTGRSYGESPYPDSQIMSLWNEYGKPFGLAMGGRVGYNMGGDTGIIAAAPGMPEGMQLDGRDGLFISQGIEEKADDVPAMLSKNEFVLTADAMKGFDKMSGGNGNPRAAAQKMYQFMDQMEAIA